MTSTRSEIITGIEAELASADASVIYEVSKVKRDRDLWVVTVDLSKSSKKASRAFDESLEGATAWWPGPAKGSADVLSVDLDEERLNLRFATSKPPAEGERLWIYLPRYLEALLECWSGGAWGDSCVGWLERAFAANSFDPSRALDPSDFPWLRRKQQEAFDLPGWGVSFLDGPPGTGKTTTLGALLAQYLSEFPSARVLLLSTTNVAVDQALVSVDRALEELGDAPGAVVGARGACFRLGNHFVASEYKGREHLIPVPDADLVIAKQALETNRPPVGDTHAYKEWKAAREKIDAQIRSYMAGVLDRSRLAAITATRAIFSMAELRKQPPFDLVVFDEGSQVGRAHALALAPLGKRCLVAGDPAQLSPIVQSDHPDAAKWLGTSMFHHRKQVARACCRLVEQSRMAEPICRIVSGAFYDGDLIVAEEKRSDHDWLKERTLRDVPPVGNASVYVHAIPEEGRWSPKLGSNIRPASADSIAEIVEALVEHQAEEDIVILTPFRAQRMLIRNRLSEKKIRRVAVSTVHRAQGSERHTILFDPTKGDSNFLSREEAGHLVNVALSRAKARLILTLSDGDRANVYMKKVLAVLEATDTGEDAVRIEDLVWRPGFPAAFLGALVTIKGVRGRIIEVWPQGDRFSFCESATGKIRKYLTAAFFREVAS